MVKALKQISRLFRIAVGASVLGVGATGYYYYGNRQHMVVRVIASDSTKANIVQTDGGTFVNNPTAWFRKDAAETESMARLFKDGNYVRITVYGVLPSLLKDAHFYKNIAYAELSTAEAYTAYQAEQLAKIKAENKPVAVDSSKSEDLKKAADDSSQAMDSRGSTAASDSAEAEAIIPADSVAGARTAVATDTAQKVKKPPQP